MLLRFAKLARTGGAGLLFCALLFLTSQARAQGEYAGSYTGAIAGGYTGSMLFTVDAQGQLAGTANVGTGPFSLSGSVDGKGLFFSGTPPNQLSISFSGSFSSGRNFSGSWFSSDFNGTFSGGSAAENVIEVTEAQAVTAINSTGGQRRNYYRRLENVRSGTEQGLNLDDLAFNFRGVTVTPGMLMSGSSGYAQLAKALGTAFDSQAAHWSDRGRREFASSQDWWKGPDRLAPLASSAAGASQNISASTAVADGVAATGEAKEPRRIGSTLLTDIGVFLNGTVSFSERSASFLDPGFDAITFGLSSGVDRRFGEKITAGAGLGYARDSTDFNNTGESTSNAVYAVFYGTATPVAGAYVDAILSVGWIGYEIDRPLAPLVFARGETDGAQLWGGVTGGYNFTYKAATLSPYFRLNGGSTWLGGYTEKNVGVAGLVYGDNTIWSLSTVLALRLDYAFGTALGVVVPYARFEYEHEFGDAPSNDVRPLAGPIGVPTTFSSLGLDRNFFNVGGGVSMSLPKAWAGFLDYDGLFGADNLTRHTLTAGIRKEF
jgi:uncharacterized protein YhjY with autotransporter beta-barrel domain